MNDNLYESIRSAKYAGIFVLMTVFPNETVMPLVGYAAANSHISLPFAVLAGAAGSTLGSTVVYALARLIPDSVIERFIERYGKWLGMNQHSIDKAGKWFDRHDAWTVFLGRFIPGVRTAVSVPAGLRRMPFLPFLFYSALGSTACCILLAYIGYTARNNITQIHAVITSLSTFLYLLLLTMAAAFIFWRIQKRHNK